MKLREIFRFELAYQVRRVSTWLFFGVLVAVTFLFTRESYLHDARNGDFFLNSPFVVAIATVFGSLIWLLIAASVAGEAATRDARTRAAAPLLRATDRFLAYRKGPLATYALSEYVGEEREANAGGDNGLEP